VIILWRLYRAGCAAGQIAGRGALLLAAARLGLRRLYSPYLQPLKSRAKFDFNNALAGRKT